MLKLAMLRSIWFQKKLLFKREKKVTLLGKSFFPNEKEIRTTKNIPLFSIFFLSQKSDITLFYSMQSPKNNGGVAVLFVCCLLFVVCCLIAFRIINHLLIEKSC